MTLPEVPESFTWAESSAGPILRCSPLAAIARHGFTTRKLQLSSPEDWDRLAAAIGTTTVLTVNQVHGRAVVAVSDGAPLTPARPDADALISRDENRAIAVRAADCVPVLLADPVTGAVAAVHAGWRGTAAGVVTAAVEAMAREFGVAPSNLIAAIGPSIRPCCYEVGSELVDAFAAAGHPRHLVDRWFALRNKRLTLDVAGANRDQLMLAGVPRSQLHDCGLCTAMHLDVLTSFRAEKEQAGRLAAAIAPAISL
jgi:YfiH family protein